MQIDGSGSNLYRAYNPNSGEHFYTKDSKEIDKIKRAGWRYEGVAGSSKQWKKMFIVCSIQMLATQVAIITHCLNLKRMILLNVVGAMKGFHGQLQADRLQLSQRTSLTAFLILANTHQ